MSRLSVNQLAYSIGNRTLLDDFSMQVDEGLHVILGANGAGKSTLLSLLSADMKADSGEIYLDSKNIHDFSLKELAVKRSVLTQENLFSFPLTVLQVCSLALLDDAGTKNDIHEVMEKMNLLELGSRKFNELSGGEKQRVHLARVFSQGGHFVFLDEPLNNLDIKYQLSVMNFLKEKAQEGRVIICILHDIQLALAFADTLSLLKNGETIFQQAINHQMDKQQLSFALSETFDIHLSLDEDFQVKLERNQK